MEEEIAPSQSRITHPNRLHCPIVTVPRAQGLRVVILVNDHLRAHVRVFSDGEAKINLCVAAGRPDLVWADTTSCGEVRRAMRIAA